MILCFIHWDFVIRWSMIADDIWDMILGKAGRLPGPLAPEIIEKAKNEGRQFFEGNPQDNYPDALDKYRKLMNEKHWEVGEDEEEPGAAGATGAAGAVAVSPKATVTR